MCHGSASDATRVIERMSPIITYSTGTRKTSGTWCLLVGYKIESLVVRKYGYDRFAANFAFRYRLGETGFRGLRACLIALRPFREVELIARR